MSAHGFQFLAPSACERPYTISEINNAVSRIIDASNPLVWLEGEISNCKVSSNGHCYLRLKDQDSQIPAVIWRSTMLKMTMEPEDGIAVIAIAAIKVYTKGGYYQLDIQRMEPLGKGALSAAFEKLKAKLYKEGLFDLSHKLDIPKTVNCLGVVTSKQGAAIRDIVKVVAMRAPQTEIVIIDVPVQGDGAAQKIAAAIRVMSGLDTIDCMIVGRGGGSAEDLMPFNDESVARAIFDSTIPIISAVGHEIDCTIADFVADVRAPTPSAAAEIAVADREESQRLFTSKATLFTRSIASFLNNAALHCTSLAKNRALRRPFDVIKEFEQLSDERIQRFTRAFSGKCTTTKTGFSSVCARLNALSPLSVLLRGYSVVTTREGVTVKHSEQVKQGDSVHLRFYDGQAEAVIQSSVQAL